MFNAILNSGFGVQQFVTWLFDRGFSGVVPPGPPGYLTCFIVDERIVKGAKCTGLLT